MKLLIVIGLLVLFGIAYFLFQKSDDLSITADVNDENQNAESIMERKDELEDTEEGFVGATGTTGTAGTEATGTAGAGATGTSGTEAGATGTSGTATGAGATGTTGTVGPYNPVVDRPATLAELNELILRIKTEKASLQAPGPTNDITTRRLANLSNVADFVNDIITQVENKSLAENQIPIMNSQVTAFLRALNTSDQPLPDIMVGKQLNTVLGGILPSNLNNDPEVTNTIQNYIKSMATNLSWYFGFKYTSDAEKAAAQHYNRRAGQAGEGDTDFYADNFSKASAGYDHQPSNYMDQRQTTDEFANMPQEGGRGPGEFDWKRRSEEICKAIKGRKLNPEDYGCMPEKTEVSSDFSYRGYANMICTRLAANYDTGTGSLVGCPPLDWPGWRLS